MDDRGGRPDTQNADDLPEAVIAVPRELESHSLQRHVIMGVERCLVEAVVVLRVHVP